jgi:hypothetical protein
MLPFYFNIVIFINSKLFLMSNRPLPFLFSLASALLLSLHANAKTAENFKANNSSLVFIENKGQIIDQNGKHRKDIDFKLAGKGLNIFIGDGQIHYQFAKKEGEKLNSYRLDVILVDADKNAELVTEDKQEYYENYYLPQCPNGITTSSYKKITYKNIYPNIDWTLYLTAGELKYDFIVRADGDVSKIQIKYNGATAVNINNGICAAVTPVGSITEKTPYSFDSKTKEKIKSAFVLHNNVLSFDIDKHDGELVIDPIIEWATYYGGAGDDNGYAVASDISGNPYMAGRTTSSINIATTGAYQTSLAGGTIGDAFLVKFNLAGNRRWCTYYGGVNDDVFNSLTCDWQGSIFAAGLSYSNGLATTGAFQINPAPALLVKFDSTGARQWATYYNGRWGINGSMHYVACDAAGNVYMAGSTDSLNNIATVSSHQSSLSGGQDGYLVKFNTLGQRQWATYYGGNANDDVFGIAVDPSGSTYIAGQTKSTSGIASGGYQNILLGNTNPFNAFVAKFDANGARQWGTYYGVGQENALAITCDFGGNVIIGGNQGHPGLGTVGAYQANYAGDNCFVVKFNSIGVRQWCTYSPSGLISLATDVVGNVYVGGYAVTNSGGISTPNGYHTTVAGGMDAYIIEYSSDGSQKPWASFYGGSANEMKDANGNFPPLFGATSGYPSFSNSITCSNKNRVYLSNSTASALGIAYQGFQNSYGGGASDAFLVSFISDTIPYIIQPYTDTLFCAGDSIRVPYGVSAPFNANNIFTLQLSDGAGNFITPVNIGSLTAQNADTIHGRIPTNTLNGVNYKVRIISTNPSRTSASDSVAIHVKAIPQSFAASSNSPVCIGDSIKFSSSSSSTGVSYTWSGPVSFTSALSNPKIPNALTVYGGNYVDTATLGNGCKITDTVTVHIDTLPPQPTIVSNSPLCTGATLNLNAPSIAGGTYMWTGANNFTSTVQSPTRLNVTTTDAGKYYVTARFTSTGCKSTDSTTVIIYPVTPAPVAGNNSPLCVGGILNLTASTISNASYSWSGPSYGSNQQNPSKMNMQLANAGTYTVIANVNGCPSAPASTIVTVITGPSVAVYASPSSTICTGAPVALVAVPTNIGTNPATYNWYKNSNNTGGTGSSYIASAPSNSDVFYVMMTAGTACNTPISSNSITITTVPTTPPPAATIIASPGTDVWPYLNVTFSISSLTNGGTTPGYQWKLNGANVTGATKNTWSTTELRDGDSVCLWVTSSDQCATPKSTLSNCLGMKVPTGVGPLNPLRGDLQVYPNPVTSSLVIEGASVGTTVQVNNIIGQTVYRGVIRSSKETINTSQWVPGGYLLHLTGKDGNRVTRKVVK